MPRFRASAVDAGLVAGWNMAAASSESVTERCKAWHGGTSLVKAVPMSDHPIPAESLLALAESHVKDGEMRVAKQRRILEEMKRDNHPRAEKMAQKLLVSLEKALENYRIHLQELRVPRGQ